MSRVAPAKHALRGRPRERTPSLVVGSVMRLRAQDSNRKKASPDDAEGKDVARKLRPPARPYLNALLANAILALALVGFPFLRGRSRAEGAVHAFAEYTACLHGGEVSPSLGLSMPRGYERRFAALYLRARPEWPASCEDALDRIAPPPVTLLLPGAKQGEEEVRAALIGVRAGFDELVLARGADRIGQIPERPLRSLAHLTAALAILVEANDLSIDGTHQAFDLGEGLSLATPSRVPLESGRGGPLLVTPLPDGVRAVAADSRAIMVTRAESGTVYQLQVRRPGAARAIIDDGTATYLGWVTSETACEGDDAHCAHRLLGLARVREEGRSPSPEVWLAAHPALPLARSFALSGNHLSVLARTAADGIELRVFDLPAEWPPPIDEPTEAPIEPLVARRVLALGACPDAIVQEGSVAFVDASSTGVSVASVESDGATAIAGTEGTDALVSCGARVIALGPHSARGVSLLDRSVLPAIEAFPARPIHRPDPLDDTGRCAWSRSGTSFAWLDTRGVLRLAPDITEPRVVEVSQHVAGFAIARTGETVYLATWGADGHRDVTLARWWRGRELAHEVVAACWQNGEGFCGSAGLASDGEHVVLFARERTDLLVLAVTGAGVAPLTGLGVE